eukprot:1690401-Alexandrium_andersonii.AAC.1
MAADSFPARRAGTSVGGTLAELPPSFPARARLAALAVARARGATGPLPAPGVRLGGLHPSLGVACCDPALR